MTPRGAVRFDLTVGAALSRKHPVSSLLPTGLSCSLVVCIHSRFVSLPLLPPQTKREGISTGIRS